MIITNIKIFLILILCSLQFFVRGQNIDSLKTVLKDTKQDTVKCKVLFMLVEKSSDEEWPKYNDELIALCEQKLQDDQGKLKVFYLKFLAEASLNKGYLNRLNGDYEKALACYEKSQKIQEELDDKKGLATSIFNTGVVYQAQSNNVKALVYFTRCEKIQLQIANKSGLAETYFSIGSIHDFLGDIPKALDYYNKSLKMAEESGNKKVVAYALNNIGAIYSNQDDILHAIEYYNKSLKLYRESKDKNGIAISLNNIGGMMRRQHNIAKALEYYEMGLKAAEEAGNKREVANSLANIGVIYLEEKKETAKALDYFTKSLKIQEEIGYKKGIANVLCSIGKTYVKQQNYLKAEEYAQKALAISKEIGFPQNIYNVAMLLDDVYEKQNKPANALQMYKLAIAMRDSINNKQTQKASIRREFQYNYEKKAAADSVANAKEKEIKQAQINQQSAEIKAKRNQQYALYGGLILVLIFAGFMYNRFKITQNQNKVITNQKQLIEEKHKEITDSINYAERIQRSFLATKNLLDENLGDYFVFFQPKAVVSGDFYWASKLTNGNFAYVTADSTGHGVPGAIMSILNISSLEKAIETTSEPSAILNETRKTIINRLKKDGSSDGGKDGMDCSLVILDKNKKQLVYASANNPVWIVRDGQLLELLPDKMPVGKHDKDETTFTQQVIELNTNDVVYTLTDGFPDQFGGEHGKKFKYKPLKEMLISISRLPMHEQEQKLSEALITWKGNLEQIDDITIIGVRI